MGGRHVDRIWIFAGAAVIVVLAAAGWFLLISPKYTEAADIRAQADTTRTQQLTLKRKLSELQKQSTQLAEFQAVLKKNQQALPSGSGVPDFLRQLQSSGDSADVIVSNVTVAPPTLVTDSTTVYEVAMTMNADGTPDQLGAFLVRLQDVQPRAVLIGSANLVTQDAGAATLNLMLKAYIAPPAGSGTPTITTK